MNKKIAGMFSSHSSVRWDMNRQGSSLDDEGTLILGGRAGPEIHPLNLLHEMAHLIDIDDKRCTTRNWGLKVPEVEILGRFCPEPMTFQASERELQVVAIQFVLSKFVGVKMSLAQWATLVEYLPDYYMFKDFFRSPRSRFRGTTWTRMVTNHAADLVDRIDLDAVLSEWDRKCKLVEYRRTKHA